jgi:hypothetical protein
MKEMCRRVNAPYKEMDFTKKDWYLEYSWSAEEQLDFEKWLVDYFYKNNEARRELLTVPKNKVMIIKAVSWFVLSYGWKLK